MQKLIEVKAGEIYAIPLFLSDESSIKSFSRDNFKTRGKEFVFCRIIEDLSGGGLLIEIFDLVGTLNEDITTIISSKRLFPAISTTGLGILKKRWKKLYLQENYDREKDSQYSEITLVAGTEDSYQLWKGGKGIGFISNKEAEKYEIWQVWTPSQLEKRIIKKLNL